jgi:hypothetical protein
MIANHPADFQTRAEALTGIPWKSGGRSRDGVDCVGLVKVGLAEQFGVEIPEVDVTSYPAMKDELESMVARMGQIAAPGDVCFFRKRDTGKIQHVALHLGERRLAHAINPSGSRVDVGFTFLRRVGLDFVGAFPKEEVGAIATALQSSQLGWDVAIPILISIALSAASAFLVKKPKLPKFRNQSGRYGFDGLITRSSTEIPLPDLLGRVTVAGNSPFTSPIDRSLEVTDETQQAANRVVVLGSGPLSDVDFTGLNVKVNGLQLDNAYWHDGANLTGFAVNPAQTKAEAVTGSIAGDTLVPSVTLYLGSHATEPPVDIRASYDRNFPLYGFNGCGYLVFRAINSTKFTSFNITATVDGRLVRTFDENGFLRTTVSGESLTGDGVSVRFKLAFSDVESVSSLTVGGVEFTELGPTNQTGNVFHLNKTRGYVEFLTAPAAAAAILVSYTRFNREWSDNIALFWVYLMTQKRRGKGLPEDRIDWARAVAARDYWDEEIEVETPEGLVTTKRGRANYAIDFKKGLEEHMQAILDAGYAYMFSSSGKWVIKPRKDEEPTFDFTVANIVQGTFKTVSVARQDRVNQVRLIIRTGETYNAEAEVSSKDPIDQADRRRKGAPNNGVVEKSLPMPAVDDEAQATLLADTIRAEYVGLRWMGSLTTKAMGLPLEPGDVVTVTHPSRPSWVLKKFRVEDLDSAENDDIEVKFSEYVPEAYRE